MENFRNLFILTPFCLVFTAIGIFTSNLILVRAIDRFRHQFYDAIKCIFNLTIFIEAMTLTQGQGDDSLELIGHH